MSHHPVIRQTETGADTEWHCPYCQTTGAMIIAKAEWAAAHGPCQAAAELLTPEELFTTYVTKP